MALDFYAEKELFDPVKLCKPNGRLDLNSIGWSRKPIFECNLSGRWLRKKKWNYWAISNKECLFSVTVTNLDYAGMVFMYLYDFYTHAFTEKTYIIPFGRKCTLPNAVHKDLKFLHSKVEVSMTNEGTNTHISVKCGDFGGIPLTADLLVQYPENYETLNVVIPWNENTFQFTSKHEGMSATGSLQLGKKLYNFEPESSFACLDFGRGIWPRKIGWNWAYVSGISNGRRIGLNLGARWTDHTGMTENAIVLDGKLNKISEDVIFEYDSRNYLKDWRIRTKYSNQVDLIFHPVYERVANNNFFPIKSELHQVIGHVSGTIKPNLNSDETIALTNLTGCTEDHYSIW